MLTLLATVIASQLVVTPPDPPTSAPAQAAPLEQPVAPIDDDDPAEPAADDDPVADTTDAYDTVDEYDLDDAAAVQVVPPAASPPPAARDASEATIEAPPGAAAPAASVEVPATTSGPCPVGETAGALRLGGLIVGGVSLLAALATGAISLYERAQAQDLLDHSPAFGKVGDRYVERDPAHPDVAAYDAHRAASSILSQLSWFALGLGLAGAGVAGTALWLGEQAEACQAR